MTKRLLLFMINVLLIALSCEAQSRKKPTALLPATDLYDLNGKHVNLAQLGKNKVVFIDCWFIPCPPCFREMGMLHKLYAKYKNNKDIISLTICRTDSGIVKRFIAQDKSVANWVKWYQNLSKLQNFKLPVYFIPGCNMKISTGTKLTNYEPDDKTKCPDVLFTFKGYPTTMIFNKAGKIVFKKTGFLPEEETLLNARIEDSLNLCLASK
ncbi:hypothetical protein BEL04_21225 [Mucilaginibacter sp. PPCGB 2223]|uniref:TlpA family protein disulfide reductase n=1 Tax=Mucilaginibacter sp. PPCGB 2223 TaxID=1886027 RepID=UPI000824A80A|nr:TlpA disulfide reductase family protein [Mucilaginibacter sp. PPCGB 2223]OCX51226.1 hypothetical protein BEL04_21225 [Mucilaginibacter sp. PPCGB 2223]